MLRIFVILSILLFSCMQLNASPKQDTTINSNQTIVKQFDKLAIELEYQTKIETQRLYKYLFLIGFIFSLLMIIFILYIYNSKIKQVAKLIQIQERELELKKFEVAKVSQILNHTENSIAITDLNGEILWANNGFGSLFGIPYNQLSNNDLNNVFKIVKNEKTKQQIEKCKKDKEPIIYSDDYTDEFGNKVWYQRSLVPLVNEKNEIINYAAIDADLTAVKIAMEQISIQKHKVEEQKQKITDSINYASYIQAAVLPPEENIRKILGEYFILYMPRDIVSGDFYWVAKQGESEYIVAADCTGHGVPGAFMSMLGISFLNEIVRKSDFSASDMLNQLREMVIKSLHQTGKEGEQKDGMDIALCKINKTTMKMEYAGANNSLYLIRNKDGRGDKNLIEDLGDQSAILLSNQVNIDKVLIEIKADKMPIGIYYSEEEKFRNHEVNIKKNDTIYIFSDGYADQFGGPSGRKFLAQNFKLLLLEIQSKNLDEQKILLDNTINKWMSHKWKNGKTFEQLDDILVIGVKI